jgi:hypothetical protein
LHSRHVPQGDHPSVGVELRGDAGRQAMPHPAVSLSALDNGDPLSLQQLSQFMIVGTDDGDDTGERGFKIAERGYAD